MKDPTFDAKAIVAAGYDRCAEAYAAARSLEAPPFLSRLTDRLAEGSRVLDIGCGCGLPVAACLATRFRLTGIDVSKGQIELARSNVLSGRFIHADAASLNLKTGSFDAAVMLYTLFHLPRDEQPAFLAKLRSWLVDGGLFLATLARQSESDYVEDDFFGVRMFWSNFSQDETKILLRDAGFSLIWEGTTSHGYREEPMKPEIHPVVLLEAA